MYEDFIGLYILSKEGGAGHLRKIYGCIKDIKKGVRYHSHVRLLLEVDSMDNLH